MTATREQIRAFYAMLGSLKLRDMKDELVEQASNGRTTHSSDLTVQEMRSLLEHLAEKSEQVVRNQRANQMRRRIFSMCYSLGWTVWDDNIKKYVADQQRLDAWMLKYGYLHKDLKDYNYSELPRLVTQFENLLKSTFA